MPEIDRYRGLHLDEESVHDALNVSIERIRRLNNIPVNDPELWRDAEDRSYKAIHEFANYYGIGHDDVGLKQRQLLAIYIDKSIRNDVNPLNILNAHELLHIAETDSESIDYSMVVSPEYKTRFNWVISTNPHTYTETNSDHDMRELSEGSSLSRSNFLGAQQNQEFILRRFRLVEKLRGFFSKSEHAPTSSRSNKLKRDRLIVKGIASIALIGVVMFGVSKGLSEDEQQASKEESNITTVINQQEATTQERKSISTTQNDRPMEQKATAQVNSDNMQNTEQSNNLPQKNNPTENSQVFAVVEQELSVQKGDNLWRLLQNNFAYLNIEKHELNRRIGMIMPEISKANPNIRDLNVLYSGQKIIINQEAIDIMLKA